MDFASVQLEPKSDKSQGVKDFTPQRSNIRLTTEKRVDGTMYSCISFGTKVGGGIGTAITGWLLAASGYVSNAATQSQSCINMLHVMYLWLPMIFNLCITLILTRLNVEKAVEEKKEQ